MAIEVESLTIPIRAVGEGDIARALTALDRQGQQIVERFRRRPIELRGGERMTQTLRQVGAEADVVTQRLLAIRRADATLDATRQRIDVLAQGVERAATRAASLTKLQREERVLHARLQQGNLSLNRRIQLEGQLARVQTAITSGRRAAEEARITAALNAGNVSLLERLNLERQLVALRASAAGTAGIATGFLSRAGLSGGVGALVGGAAAGAALVGVLGAVRGVTLEFGRAVEEADRYDAAIRKLKATAQITQVPLAQLEGIVGRLAADMELSTDVSVDLVQQMVRLTSQAGQVNRTGEATAAWLDLAAANGLTAAQALEQLAITVRGQDEGLNRLGLLNPQQIYEKWAEAAGTTAAKLSAAEKAQAILNEVTVTASRVEGEYARSLESAAGKAELAELAHDRFSRALGRLIEPVRNLINELERLTFTGLAQSLETLAEFQVQFVPGPFGAALPLPVLQRLPTEAGPIDRSVLGGASPLAGSQFGAGLLGGRFGLAGSPFGPLPSLAPPGLLDAEGIDETIQQLTRALELGIATNAERVQAIALVRALRESVRDESLALDERNQRQEQLNDLLTAMRIPALVAADLRAGEIASLEELARLGAIEAGDLRQARQLHAAVTAALREENLSRARRVELLRQQAALNEVLLSQARPAPGVGVRATFGVDLDSGFRGRGRGARPVAATGDLLTFGRAPVVPFGGFGAAEGFGERAAQAIEASAGRLDAAFDTVEEQLAARITAMNERLGSILRDGLVNVITAAAEAIGRGDNLAEAVLGVVGTMMVRFGAALVEFGVIMSGIAPLLSNPFTAGPAAIAAGAALVALGSALSAAVSGEGAGGGGGFRGSEPERTRIIVSDPTANVSADALEPRRPILFQPIVVGVNDPQAQRAVKQMYDRAVSRGVR